MSKAVQVGQLVINMAADIAELKVNLAEGVRESKAGAEKMAAELGAIKKGFQEAVGPLQDLTIKIGSLESNLARAQSTALSLGKGLILGAAAGMSIDALAKKINGVIDSMATLKTVSEKTGSSVENLSKLSFAAKQSGSDLDSVAGALAKMSKGMAGADDETKGAGRALAFLGVSAKDSAGNLKDPAAMFVEIAKKLDGYTDGAGKAAIAQALFGKAGADMLPTLKLIGEQGDIVAKVTDAQATAARQYQRDLAKLDAQKNMVFKTIATALLPTMTDFAGAMLEVSKNTNLANGAVKDMAKDDGLTSWADAAAMGAARLVDVIVMIPKLLSAVAGSFKVVGADINMISVMAENANPLKAAWKKMNGGDPVGDIRKAMDERNKVLADANKKYDELWNYEGDAMEKAMAKRIAARARDRADRDKDEKDKPALNFSTVNDDSKGGPRLASLIAGAQAELDGEKSVYESRMKMLDLYHTKFGLADDDFYAGRANARADYIAAEAVAYAKETSLALAAQEQARNPAEVSAAKDKYAQLTNAHRQFVESMRDAGGVDRANQEADGQKQYDDMIKAMHAAGTASIMSLDQQIAKQKEHNAEIGKSKEQIELARQAENDASTADMAREAKAIDALLNQADLQGILVGRDREFYAARLAYLDIEIGKRKTLSGLFATGADLEAGAKAAADLDKYLDPEKAKEFGNALKGSLGTAAASMIALTNAMQKYGKEQGDIEKQYKNAEISRRTGQSTQAEYLDEINRLNARNTKEQLNSYGNMASAAAGFFDEHSRGYQALTTVSQVFHAAELAMTMAELVPKAISAVLTQGQGDPYTAFGRMAAMGALVAGLGVAIGGIGGGNVARDRQAAQGAGSVLGDSDAKSESLKKSLDLIEKNTYQDLAISNSMLATLKSIDSNISSFASQLVRSTDITNPDVALNTNNGLASTAGMLGMTAGGAALGGMAGAGLTAFTSLGAVGGPIGMVAGAIAGAILGKIPAVANLMTSVFGGKQSVEDSGFKMDATSLASILSNGAHAYQYADIKTSGGWFRSDKHSEQSNPLSDAANQQFTSIITSLADSIKAAGGMLGLCADDFTNKLNSFVVDIGHVSLKDLKGDELQKALESVFSKLGDDMAQYAVGGLQDLQQVGEGYLETLVRVASEYQTIDVVFQSFGKTFGEVGLESIAARDRLVQLAGGLDKFTSQGEYFLTNFFSEQEQAAALKARVQPVLDQYGLQASGEGAMRALRDFVVCLDTTTEAGAQAYATLMQYAPAIKQIADAEQHVYDERKDLQDKLDELTMTSAQLREKERAAIDASNLALYDEVQAAQAAKDAIETHNSLLEIQAQIYQLTGDKAAAAAVLEQQHAAALATLDPALVGATQKLWDLQAAANATQQVKADATTLLGGVDDAFSALQKVVDREKTATQQIVDAHTAAVTRLQGLSQALHSAFDGSLTADQKLAARAQAQAEIRADLAITKAGGTLSEAQVESLKKALGAVTQDASKQFGSREDYMFDLLRTQSEIAQLGDITDDSLSIEQKALDVAKDNLKRLDDIVANGQAQIDELKGQSVATLSLAQAIAALQGAIGGAKSNPVVGGTSTIAGFYQDLLGRAPDQDGLKFWQDQLAHGISLDAIRAAFMRGDEYKDHQKALGIPGFARGGDFGGGWRLVGEDGPELEATGPARIFNAQQTSGLLSRIGASSEGSTALVNEMRGLRADNAALREEVKGLRAETRAVATHAATTAGRLKRAIKNDTLEISAPKPIAVIVTTE